MKTLTKMPLVTLAPTIKGALGIGFIDVLGNPEHYLLDVPAGSNTVTDIAKIVVAIASIVSQVLPFLKKKKRSRKTKDSEDEKIEN